MESLKELYKIGPGSSSTYTIAPYKAAQLFKERFKDAISYDAELYGSLSLSGKGYHTDQIIISSFAPKMCKIYFRLHWQHQFENGFIYKAYDERNRVIGEWTIFSLGSGSIRILEEELDFQTSVYPFVNLSEFILACRNSNLSLPNLVKSYEPDIEEHLALVLDMMLHSVKNGLNNTGLLPGLLEVSRRAKSMILHAENNDDVAMRNRLKVMAYAFANNEENACNGMVVCAPSCGSSGVMASLIYHYYYDLGFSKQKLIQALMVAGVIGNVVKTNATIIGSIGGCQAEIGTACAMAAAAASYLNDLSLSQIEYAAESALEHHLGLTCDTVGEYVITPCIERNAVAILRALDASMMAEHNGFHKKNLNSFDAVVRKMNYTGQKILMDLRESIGSD